MRIYESDFILPLPVNDTAQLFEHSKVVWGQFEVDDHGKIGGVHEWEIPGLAQAWVAACDTVVVGHQILMRSAIEGIINGDSYAPDMLSAFSSALEGVAGFGDKLELVKRAKNAFAYLANEPVENLEQIDVDAAQILVMGFDRHYEPRLILASFAK